MNEAERIKQVYRHYRESKVIAAQWDEDHPGNVYISLERDKTIANVLNNLGYLPLQNKRILDLGCGRGKVLAGFLKWGAKSENLYGVDLLSDRVEEARRSFPHLNFQCNNAERLSFSDGFFNLILFFTVFSSIWNGSMAKRLAKEALRVLKTGGLIIIYDVRYPNPFNPHTRPISKRLIKRWFGENVDSYFYSLTLIPLLARFLAPLSFKICYLLEKIPFLKSHHLIIIRKI